MDYDMYLRSDKGGKQFIMRHMFQEHAWMKQTIETLARKVDELEQERNQRKGVPDLLKEMGKRAKKPNSIA